MKACDLCKKAEVQVEIETYSVKLEKAKSKPLYLASYELCRNCAGAVSHKLAGLQSDVRTTPAEPKPLKAIEPVKATSVPESRDDFVAKAAAPTIPEAIEKARGGPAPIVQNTFA